MSSAHAQISHLKVSQTLETSCHIFGILKRLLNFSSWRNAVTLKLSCVSPWQKKLIGDVIFFFCWHQPKDRFLVRITHQLRYSLDDNTKNRETYIFVVICNVLVSVCISNLHLTAVLNQYQLSQQLILDIFNFYFIINLQYIIVIIVTIMLISPDIVLSSLHFELSCCIAFDV